MSGDSGMGPWISSRICEALDQANLARAVASDLEDHAFVGRPGRDLGCRAAIRAAAQQFALPRTP
jgi:hypothetical protein